MKFLCIGRNYVEHAKELGNEVPEEPVIFMKPKSALLQQNMPFYYPAFTNELHYECEVVLRISKNGKYIIEENAHQYYDAISVGIDFTARDVQSELKKRTKAARKPGKDIHVTGFNWNSQTNPAGPSDVRAFRENFFVNLERLGVKEAHFHCLSQGRGAYSWIQRV